MEPKVMVLEITNFLYSLDCLDDAIQKASSFLMGSIFFFNSDIWIVAHYSKAA